MKTSYSRRELYALGEPLGEGATRIEGNRRIYGGGGGLGSIVGGVTGAVGNLAGSVGNTLTGGGGGGGSPDPIVQIPENNGRTYLQTPSASGAFSQATPSAPSAPSISPVAQTEQQQGIAAYAQPYVNTMLGATMQNLFNYDQFGNATGMRGYNPYSMNAADYIAGFSPMQEQAQRGVSGLQMPSQFQNASDAAQRAIQQAQGAQYDPLQAGYRDVNAPSLRSFQMGPAERVRTQSFAQPGSAESYMSPYMQNVVDIQKREAQRASNIAGQQQQAEAVGRGAFGGSRDALMRAERARNLATQMGDIQATGQQSAYQQAQQQFNAEQQARLQAALANQQAGLTTGTQNLAAKLGVQQLGANQNLQSQLANQQAQQQANQLAAQQQQFGANYGLANLQQQLAGAGMLGNLGNQQLAAQQGILGLQNQFGQQQQQQQQNIINQAVQNYQTAQQYPMQQLGQMKAMLAGLPISTSSQQQYQAAPSMVSQLTGLGVAGLGLGNLMGGGRTATGGATGGGSGGGGGGIGGLLNQGAGLIGNAGSWINNNLLGGFFAEGGEVNSDQSGLAGLGLYNAMNK